MVKKRFKKKKSHSKSNIVRIQVEAKSPKRKSPKKAIKIKRETLEKVQVQIQPILVDNFVALQKVMVNLATKFDSLNSQLTKLLEIFEMSAKTLAKKGFKLESSEGKGNEEVLERLGELSEQNKIIARGLTLIHETVPAQPVMIQAPVPMQMQAQPPMMMQQRPPKMPMQTAEESYKKSAPLKEGKPEQVPSSK